MGDREAVALAVMTAGTGKLQDFVTGGLGDLSPADVAYCLGGISGGPYLLARVKYLFDETCVIDLEREAMLEASRWIRNQPKPGTIRNLVRLAMLESIPPQLCPACRGRGNVPSKRSLAMQTCHICGGHGTKSLTKGDRRRYMIDNVDGFTADDWKQWRPDADRIYNLFTGWDRKALRHIAKRLTRNG